MMRITMLLTLTRIIIIQRAALLLSPSFTLALQEVTVRPAHEWMSFKHISLDLSPPANKKHLPLACQTLQFTPPKPLSLGKPQPPNSQHMKPCTDTLDPASLAWAFSHKNLNAQQQIVDQNGTCGLCFLPSCHSKMNCKVSFIGYKHLLFQI